MIMMSALVHKRWRQLPARRLIRSPIHQFLLRGWIFFFLSSGSRTV